LEKILITLNNRKVDHDLGSLGSQHNSLENSLDGLDEHSLGERFDFLLTFVVGSGLGWNIVQDLIEILLFVWELLEDRTRLSSRCQSVQKLDIDFDKA
jgi:hypothetical protein